MKRGQERARRRARAFQASSREIDIPLPLRGLFVEAESARVSGLYAAELLNLASDGLKLKTVPGVNFLGEPASVLQRFEHAFGATPRYIEVKPTQIRCGSATLSRTFSGQAMAATLSSNTILADGFGMPVRFDGTSFATCDYTSDVGADVFTLDGIIAHHDRAYLWKSDGALEFHTGDVGAVTGELVRFPLDRLGSITGSIVGMRSLTVDAGHGMNDILAIFTSTGQIIAYEGLDPTDPNDWRLLGRVQAAAPVSKNAFAQIGSDVWMLTPRGLVSVGESLRSSTLALVSEVSRPIATLLQGMVKEGGDWSLTAAQDSTMFVLNRVKGYRADQIIYTPESRAFSTADMQARAFHNFNGSLEGTGLDGRRMTLVEGGSTEVKTLRWVSSWFEAGRTASVAYVKPTIRTRGPSTMRVTVLSDFKETAADRAEALQEVTLTAERDDGGIVTISDEIGCDASGSCFQITIEVDSPWTEIIGLKVALA